MLETSALLIVIFNLLWNEFDETNATFRSASTDLDHVLVVCDSPLLVNCSLLTNKRTKQTTNA